MDSNDAAVLKTILYADIFDAPIDINRLSKFVFTSKYISEKSVKESVTRLIRKKIIVKKNEFVFLANQKVTLSARIPERSLLAQKMKIATKASHILATIGMIQFIGLSGSMASGNASEAEDIDFFIIAKAHTLWITRLLCIVLLEVFGLRRRRGDLHGRDKICLNMFISDGSMLFPKERRDIYTAVEITQLIPLFSRNNTYSTFLLQNMWIKKHLANFSNPFTSDTVNSYFGIHLFTFSPVLQLAKRIQISFMKLHKTTETVTDDLFAFHPKDYRVFVLKEYKKRLKKYLLS